MKKLILFATALFLLLQSRAQDKLYDSIAVTILDRMASVIGDLKSCSLTVETEYDSLDTDLGFLKHHGTEEVYFSGDDKMLVLAKGERGHLGFWYNGTAMAYYSFTNNHYGYMDSVPENTLAAIDMVHDRYAVDFPAADFFYPTFTDDLISNSDRIEYLGKVDLDGTDCFYIVAKEPDMSVQIWIRDDAFMLPQKMVIISKKGNSGQEFEANYSNWTVNPDLPDAMFDFVIPPGATKLIIVPAK